MKKIPQNDIQFDFVKFPKILIDPNKVYCSIMMNLTCYQTMPDLFFLSSDPDVAAEDAKGKFDRSIVDEVWDLAEVISGNDSAIWRQDQHGSVIRRTEYGKSSSSYGWEVSDTRDGLRAVHIENL